ncbi:thermonuclease family protein [Allosphingosinicella sp.]|uniref:thermonuclease family protein n=1 Tax=Allosphingosinicella sp. TaxID=2823234 RepID=UPI003783111B
MRRRTLLLVSTLSGIGMVAGALTAFGAGGSRGTAVAVRVVDGDTLAVDGQRIRLFGIDAPERDQMCEAGGRSYACGRAAGEALARLIGDARPACAERDRDPYGRSVAVCRIAGRDLNRAMVAEGWAVAYTRYSRDYVRDEAEARRARRGLWQGRFERPEQYRVERR